MQNLHIIGRAETIDFPEYGISGVFAKVDTGADLSSIWASDIHESGDTLTFKLFSPESPLYTGETITITKPGYLLTRVASSFGHREVRYVVKLAVKVKGRTIRATFSLSDRSTKTYPILIGRKLLNGKFLVDVSQGKALLGIERDKKRQMKQDLEEFQKWEQQA